MQKRLPGLIALLAFLATGPASFGGGVTVITHGFNSDADTWVLQMCERIPLYPGFQSQAASVYRMYVTRPNSVYNVTCTFHQGSSPVVSDSGEIIIALDWGDISGAFQPSVASIAVPVANALLSTTQIPELGGRALAQLPLHLVGHSRGAVLMAEVARVLGGQGVWVDHLTLLDPYPSPLNSDPTPRNYANVFFAENYRQADNFPTGVTVPGTYDRLLTALSSGGYGAGSEHSDVHLWYHGTLDFRTPVLVDGVQITGAERTNWWTSGEQRGTNVGFIYSLIGGGNRFLTNNPSGAAGRISDGVNKLWDFGAGLLANRTALPQNNGTWPNVVQFLFENGGVLGSVPLPATVRYQHGTGAANAAALTLCLDADTNPWNTNHLELGTVLLAGTGTGNVHSTTVDINAPGVLPGIYPVFARTMLGGLERYSYAPQTVTIPPRIVNARLSQSDFVFDLLGRAGWRIVIQESTDLTGWTPVETNVMTSATEEIKTAAVSGRRFFRAVLQP